MTVNYQKKCKSFDRSRSHHPGKFFVCLFCCFTSQVNNYGHGGTVSSPNHTFFQGKLEQAVNQYFMHILSLVTDNNPSWMNQRKGGEWPYKLFHNQSPRKYGTRPGSKSRPLDLQSDLHLLPDTLPTALCGPVSPGRLQSKTLLTTDGRESKIDRNSVFDCHLLPAWRQMAIKNSVSNDFWSTFVDSINVFDCCLPGV